MIPYKDLDGDSGVAAYEYGEDYIKVQFKGGATYTYTHNSAGSTHVENMKQLADKGDGLNSYIQKYKPGFSSRR